MKGTIYQIPFVRDIQNTTARRTFLVAAFLIIFVTNCCISSSGIVYAWTQNHRALIASFRKYWRE
jgi:hypothetical protein